MPVGPDDVFLINSTSGTTELPKCVVHTQNRWYYFHQKAVANGELSGDDVFLPVIPTPYGFGIWTSHTTPIHLGATTVRIDRSAPSRHARRSKSAVPPCCAVSTQLAMIVADESCRGFDLGSLRIVFTGGEPLPYAQTARFEELTGATILQFYGSNETGMLSATSIADPLHRRLRAAGRIVPEMQVRLFDGARDVTESGRGQPACRGPALSLGYFGGTDHDQLYTQDGWMRMGDICELDSEGYLSLTGRTSDFILRGGKNIGAVAVEEVVATHPAVAVVAAVAMPDQLFGERCACTSSSKPFRALAFRRSSITCSRSAPPRSCCPNDSKYSTSYRDRPAARWPRVNSANSSDRQWESRHDNGRSAARRPRGMGAVEDSADRRRPHRRTDDGDRVPSPREHWLRREHGRAHAITAAVDWLYSGVATRYPDLKICMSEAGIGWVTGLLDRLDHMLSYHEMYGTWKALGETLSPADVFTRNFWFCAVEDQSSFIQHERIGEDNILLEADYPHCDSTWPHTQRTVHEQIKGLPESIIRKVMWENASRLYQHPVPVAVQEDPNAY